ncbi:MAG: glycoside hydrolase family 130 protein [Spirochaetes bacterium]|nr:glycoside hydrolase family 130 protein [Spirochaetota bacterium]
MKSKTCDYIKNMPWENRPSGCNDVIWRFSGNPVIGWNPGPDTARIYNSAVIVLKDKFAGVFRADHKNGRAALHYGESSDGIRWNITNERIQWVDEKGKRAVPSYAYDPRVAEIDGRYFISWCDDFNGPSIGVGYTDDFKKFIRLPNAFIPYNRNGVLFPEKVNGKYLMLSRPSDTGHTPFGDIFLSESPDMIHWGNHKLLMKKGGQGWWQGMKIGAGPVPLKTEEGWLLIYHGVSSTCNGYVYSIGGAILDSEDPSKVLYRSGNYLLTPELPYEVSGFVPNVLFPCSMLSDDEGRIAIYYGAADTYSAIAFGMKDEIIDYIKRTHEDIG